MTPRRSIDSEKGIEGRIKTRKNKRLLPRGCEVLSDELKIPVEIGL